MDCHLELNWHLYPDSSPRESCFGCQAHGGPACGPNLPTIPLSRAKPNVLIVGDSISHGYFPVLAEAINGSIVQLQHAPSNTGALAAGLACWNITTLLGATGSLPQPWDLVVFNFGLHDTKEWTPPPWDGKVADDDRSTSVEKYMVLLRRYTELVLHSR